MPYVTDTHAIIWHVTDDPKLSPAAKKVFEETDSGRDRVFIPCIVFFELLYLTEKRKVSIDFNSFVAAISSSENYKVEPLCLPIIEKIRAIPRDEVPDPWDRLIAATSLHLRLPLITRDRTIQKIARKVGIEIVW